MDAWPRMRRRTTATLNDFEGRSQSAIVGRTQPEPSAESPAGLRPQRILPVTDQLVGGRLLASVGCAAAFGESKPRRARLFLLGLVAVLLAGFVAGTAHGDPLGQLDPFISSADGLFAPSLLGPDAKAALAEQTALAAIARSQDEAFLASATAGHQRLISRTAFEGMHDEDAELLAQQTFPGVLSNSAAGALHLPPGAKVTRYLSDHSARVTTAAGDVMVVQSTLPLRVVDSSGDKVPSDLSLSHDGSGFAPSSPLVPIQIGGTLGAGVSLTDTGVTIVPPGAPATVADQVGEAVVYPNAERDEDTIVRAEPLGAEVSTQLRSAQSPEDITFRFRLPADAKLQRSAAGDLGEVVVSDGKVIVRVAPASATDAQGSSVPVSESIDGDVLTLHVSHRAGDWAYPILVDPQLTTDSNLTSSAWSFSSSNSGFSPFQGNAYLGTGLYIRQLSGSVYYSNLDQGYWYYQAPGDLSIVEADFDNVNNDNPPGTNMCFFLGILDQGSWDSNGSPDIECADQIHTYGNHFCTAGPCNPQSNTHGNVAIYGLEPGSSGSRTYYMSADVAATVDLIDNATPRVTNTSVQVAPTNRNWLGTGTTFTVTATGTDDGYGINKMDLTGPSGFTPQTKSLSCSVAPPSYNCPASWRGGSSASWTVSFDPFSISSLPNGVQTLTVSSTDWGGNKGNVGTGASTIKVGVDRSAPTISLNVADGTTLGDGRRTITADVEDNAGGVHQSGTKSVQIALDGEVVASGAPCAVENAIVPAGTCDGGNVSWAARGEDLGAGTHTLTVTASDYSAPANTTTKTIEVTVHHAASEPIGPGEVNLITGAFKLSASDVAVDGFGQPLAVSRTFDSRQLADVSGGPFGRGWQASLPSGVPGQNWVSLVPAADAKHATLTDATGTQTTFTKSGSTWSAPAGLQGLTLDQPSTGSCANDYVLSTADASTTCFTGSSGVFTPSVQQQPASAQAISYTFEIANNLPRPIRALAPVPAGVTCAPTLNPGCRALSFAYGSTTTSRSDCPSGWGDYDGRLTTVSLTAYDPSAGQMSSPIPVARYCYDSSGYLRGEFNPRVTPSLVTTYTYDGAGHITSLTPPGRATWNFNYGTITGDSDSGRLLSVSRKDPALPSSSTWTVAYKVPVSGAGAPYAMDSASIAGWAQNSVPTDATAIFPPDQIPASPPSSYTRATISYLDSAGRIVNIASPGGRIDTTEFDANDNVRRTLTAANRASALGYGSSSATWAALLDTQYQYSADGIDLVDSLGPRHTVKVGSTNSLARKHVTYAYDEGAPAGGPYHLVTTTKVGAAISGQADADVRTTTISYDGQGGLGWSLHAPTSVMVDPGGKNIVHTTLYNSTTGLVTETRQPARPAGGDAHATQTIYYTAAANASYPGCGGHPELANLSCKSVPAAQPGTPGLPDLPTKTFSDYNFWAEPGTVTETVGFTTRTTTDQYDGAGRITSSSTTSSVGDPLAAASFGYDGATGSLTTVKRNDQAGQQRTVTSVKDALGRLATYTDADGNVSSYSYDLDGRLVTADDGKGTQTSSYDSTTGDLSSVQDQQGTTTLTFTGTYDADGALTKQGYPNGMEGRYTYDASGFATGLAYVKTTSCSSSCTWYSESITPSIHDQAGVQTSTLSAQTHSYDATGRLTQVQDTPATSVTAANRSEYPIPTASAGAAGVATSTGAVWFTEQSANKLGRLNTSNNAISEYTIPTSASSPKSITSGSDGNMWFTESGANKIGRIPQSGGSITEYPTPGAPAGITTSANGDLWYTEPSRNAVAWVLPTYGNTFAEYTLPSAGASPQAITSGPDNALWLAEPGVNKIARFDLSARTFTEYGVPTANAGLSGIVKGPDGALWFTESNANKIGRITTSGAVTEYPIPRSGTSPTGIAAGADGALWFTESATAGKLGRITTSGAVTEHQLPSLTPGGGQIAKASDGTLWYGEPSANKIGRTSDGTLCTVRKYGFDADTNRTSLTTVPHPTFSGACDTTSSGTTQSFSYDDADRLVDSGVSYGTFGAITALPSADAGGAALTSTYYVDNTTHTQTQSGLTLTYNVDPLGRTRETLDSGSLIAAATSHYSDGSDSPSWTAEAAGGWTRYVAGIDGGLAATEEGSQAPTLELADLDGNIVAEASTSATANGFLSTSDTTEYGVPRGSSPPKYGWLGGFQRSTEFKTGVVAMGARTYVPQIGAFVQPDPVAGGGPNAYGYAAGDPVNKTDLDGTVVVDYSGSAYLSCADCGALASAYDEYQEAKAAAALAAQAAQAAQAATPDDAVDRSGTGSSCPHGMVCRAGLKECVWNAIRLAWICTAITGQGDGPEKWPPPIGEPVDGSKPIPGEVDKPKKKKKKKKKHHHHSDDGPYAIAAGE